MKDTINYFKTFLLENIQVHTVKIDDFIFSNENEYILDIFISQYTDINTQIGFEFIRNEFISNIELFIQEDGNGKKISFFKINKTDDIDFNYVIRKRIFIPKNFANYKFYFKTNNITKSIYTLLITGFAD